MIDTNNQQERLLNLSWLAGMWEGEGNISLVKASKGRIMPRATIINTDFVLIETCGQILKENNVGHYFQTRINGCANNPKHKTAKVLVVAGMKRVQTLLNTLRPFLRGHKREVAKLVIEYIDQRLTVGKYTPYSSIDLAFVEKVRTLNKKGPEESSETIREPFDWIIK